MEVPIIVTTILRLIHIVTAFMWFGLGITSTYFVLPAAANAGPSGLRFTKALFTRTAFARLLPMVSGITTLAGLLLYATGSPSYFTQLGNAVLGIGALAGLAATIHGGAITGRATRALGQKLATEVPDGEGAIQATALSSIHESVAELQRHSRISTLLMIIALLGMGLARYL